ncbi:MAG: 3-deoxy-D-manno-octulosonic acid transferase [Desulfobacteraceae bacterium]|nr:3-deoxy-D-manno-octulosonic acid transferase [Desulfobacteraceae bacterium]
MKSFNVFLLLYHLIWTCLVILCLPLFFFTKRRRILERLARSLPADPPKTESIWIHALSVGEVLSAIPLVKAVGMEYPEKDIVFTVTTNQGKEIARKELQGKVRVLLTMPVDFWWSMARVVNFIRPALFVLVETDIWPGLIGYLKKRGINSVVVNGRISPRTFRSYRRFRFFARRMLDSVDCWKMQSDLDRDRLLQIGIGEEKAKTVGNIKFDRDWEPMGEEEYGNLLSALNLESDNHIWVAGSTHRGEEDILLDVFGRLGRFFPTLRLIIAPRRVERAQDINRLVMDKGFKSVLKAQLPMDGAPWEVLILDTLGELERIYGVAKISFVGGSLTPIGGHNLLEPASFGRPVLFGPHTHNFVLMSQLLIEAGGGKRVQDREDLFETMKALLSDPETSNQMGRNAREFVGTSRGALGRVMENIKGYLHETKGPVV